MSVFFSVLDEWLYGTIIEALIEAILSLLG